MINEAIVDLEAFMKDFHENVKTGGEMVFPITVSAIDVKEQREIQTAKMGSWVAIRPCSSNDLNKTYLGVHLGDMNRSPLVYYHAKTEVLSIAPHANPAIYVPDLKRVVWGFESWWGVIDTPDKLKQITNADIDNVWYVKALRELEAKSGD